MSARVIALWDQRPVRLAFSAVAAVVLVAGLISFVVSRQSSTPSYTGGAPYTAPSATQQYGAKVKLPAEARTLARSFVRDGVDRKSTRLNSSHVEISYAVFCLKKK